MTDRPELDDADKYLGFATFPQDGKTFVTDAGARDEAYMQDAIAAAKATGTLKEVNPQDAPAPVQQGGFAARVSQQKEAPSLPDASVTAEDKAFSHLERLNASRDNGANKQNQR